MDMRDLRYFAALAENGNYLRTALDLGISQSTLSKRIMALEAELGAVLVDRSKRAITITEQGAIVRAHAVRIIAAQRAMLRELEQDNDRRGRTATIMAIPVLAAYDVPALLGRFRTECAGFETLVTESEAETILPALDRGEAELGFVRRMFIDESRHGFATIARDEAVAVLPRSHTLASASALDPADIKEERFILMGKQTLLYDFFTGLCAESGFEPSVAQTSTHADNILKLVASGAGVSLMARRVAEFHRDDGVSVVPLRRRAGMDIGIAWLENAKPSPAAGRFIRFVRELDLG